MRHLLLKGSRKTGPNPVAAPIPQAQQRPGHAGIASANFLATNAGLEVLAKGGNAFDAAIAVASTLSVVEPESSGIGGGFMAVLHRAKDDHDVFIDAREAAPAAVNRKDYLNSDGSPNRDAALKGPLSAGIPGEPAGLVLIAKRYGRLPLQQSLAPAIRTARDGFQPDPRLRGSIAAEQKDLQRWPASATKYLPDGKPPAEGAIWRDPDQARTWELIAAHGDDGFYRGATADKLIAAVRAAGGNWTLADLASYQAKERTPIVVNYRGYRIVTAPPPSSGGVAIVEILNILSGFDLGEGRPGASRAFDRGSHAPRVPRPQRLLGRPGFREDAAGHAAVAVLRRWSAPEHPAGSGHAVVDAAAGRCQ